MERGKVLLNSDMRNASDQAAGRGRGNSRRWGIATASVVVALAIALVAVYGFTGGFGTQSRTKSVVLIQKGTYYSIPAGQFNAVAFETSSDGTVRGTLWNTWGIDLFLMTPQEVVDLSLKDVVDGFSWTSGRVANLTETNLSISVNPGAWDVVFLNTDHATLNPIWTNTTVVGFYSDIDLVQS